MLKKEEPFKVKTVQIFRFKNSLSVAIMFLLIMKQCLFVWVWCGVVCGQVACQGYRARCLDLFQIIIQRICWIRCTSRFYARYRIIDNIWPRFVFFLLLAPAGWPYPNPLPNPTGQNQPCLNLTCPIISIIFFSTILSRNILPDSAPDPICLQSLCDKS